MNKPRDIYSSLNSFFYPIIYMAIVLTFIKQFAGNDSGTYDQLKKGFYNVLFPILQILGIFLSSGIFIFTPVEDREQKLRYLLNFAGMRSSAYYVGLLLADIVIFSIP